MDADALRSETLRLYHRYAIEVVEPLGLCPWARRARLDGRVMHRVVTEPDPAPADIMPHLDAVAADTRIEVGLVILPRLTIGYDAFRRFVAEIRELHATPRSPSSVTLYMADFHPDAPLDTASPARLIAFIRRTPDPTIQLVRRTVLEAVRRNDSAGTVFLSADDIARGAKLPPAAPALHERIAEDNFDTVSAYGFDRLDSLLSDIRRDRDQTYARLAASSS